MSLISKLMGKAIKRIDESSRIVVDNDNAKWKPDTYRKIVLDYVKEHLDKGDNANVTLDDVYVVWSCKTLKNYKCLISTNLIDGMYYELTYNGDKDEVYLDAYKKFENQVITL